MSHRILLTGGGSGGHVYPLVAVAKALQEKAQAGNMNLELMMMGDGSFIQEVAEENGIPFKRIWSGKLRRYSSIQNFFDLFKMPIGFIQALWQVYWFMPDVIFAKGGYASVLPVLAGRLYLIPVYLHETDSVPGLANSKLFKRAKKIFISFQKAGEYFPQEKTMLVGNPIRKELFGFDKNQSLDYFKLSPAKSTILFLGGSQGAKVINDIVLSGLVRLVQKWQVIHQCGDAHFESLQKEAERVTKEGQASYGQNISDNYRLYPFLNSQELGRAYAAADLIVSRAGGSIFEIAMAGKPTILIPITGSTNNHQMENAIEFSKYGAVVIEEENNLTESVLLGDIERLLRPENYTPVSEKIKSFAKPDAAEKIAEILLHP